MATQRKRERGLDRPLKQLVSTVEATLAAVVAEAEGAELYKAVEAVRQDMVAVRQGQPRALTRARRRIRRLSVSEQTALARAYTVYLELVNTCETTYRTHRLRESSRATGSDLPADVRAHVVFVLTAHPTESRSPTNIQLMRRIQALLIDGLERRLPPDDARLAHLLHLVWSTGTHPDHKPTVEDEALHFMSLLYDPILEELLRLRRDEHSVRLRTWVGGDKDGHPGVGPEETDRSLNLSRNRLLDFIEGCLLREVGADARLISDDRVGAAWDDVRGRFGSLRTVTIGDGRRIAMLRRSLEELAAAYLGRAGRAHPRLTDLHLLLQQFPGLVVPLELREERGRFQLRSTVADMLRFVGDVARGGSVEWYVQGCVVSMTERAEDLWEAHELLMTVLRDSAVPVIPLFETPAVLEEATAILEHTFTNASFSSTVRDQGGKFEIMLGYSDTSKRMGVLASRLAIHETCARLARGRPRMNCRSSSFTDQAAASVAAAGQSPTRRHPGPTVPWTSSSRPSREKWSNALWPHQRFSGARWSRSPGFRRPRRAFTLPARRRTTSQSAAGTRTSTSSTPRRFWTSSVAPLLTHDWAC